MACGLLMTVLASCAGHTAVSSSGTPGLTQPHATSAHSMEGSLDDPIASTGGGKAGGELDPFKNRRAMHHVRTIAKDIGVRVRATAGERKGIRYVARHLRRLGYNVKVQSFAVDGDTSHNVVASWPDSHTYRMVIGGHIDTVPGSPGANDNASGVAVLLENARLFAGSAQARWIRFVAFGSEEYGSNGQHHFGSQTYVDKLGRRGRRQVAGMISVDMIADGRPLLIGTSGIGPERVARTLHRKLDKATFAVDYFTSCDCSDNGPFELAGIPAAFMWSGDEPNYHDPSDRVRNMNPKHLRRTGRAVRHFLKRVDRGMIRYFRRS